MGKGKNWKNVFGGGLVTHLFPAFAILLFLAVPTCFARGPIRIIEGNVTRVSDGDTIQVVDNQGTKVKARLYGIDAPEIHHPNKQGQPMGEEALIALRSKVNRQRVRLEIMDLDQYKRAVAIVWLGNRNINREMVAGGWAWAYRQYLDRPHASEYIGAEENARREGKGLWQQRNPQPPWDFRKGQKRQSAKADDCSKGLHLPWGRQEGSCGGTIKIGELFQR